MNYQVTASIMPRQAILDPQGKATESGLHQSGFESISNVRIGKRIAFQVEAATEQAAYEIAENACKKLLANLIMETYSLEVTAAPVAQ
jgi:phosphoribosylformylglycinamidine synthase PurS subunit